MQFSNTSFSRPVLILLVAIVAAGLWLPRAFGLERFVATDEVVWLYRAANFYYALGQRDFAATDKNLSPGVVTMWFDAASLAWHFPEYRGLGQGYLDKYALMENLLEKHGIDPHDILVTARRLAVLLNVALLAVAFALALRLFGVLPSLLGFALLALDPYHIAVTRLAHLDGPLSSFLTVSLLAFLVYLYDGRKNWALALSGATGGLALLSKIMAFILLPAVGLTWLIETARECRSTAQRLKCVLNRLVWPGLGWAALFLLAVFVFFPAMWSQPATTLGRLARAPFGFAGEVAQGEARMETGLAEEPDEAAVVSGLAARPISYYLRYPQKYLWRSTLATQMGLLLALAAFIFHLPPLNRPTPRRALTALMLFVLLYTVLMTIPPKSSSKYYVPAYPSLDLAAGLGWTMAITWAAGRFKLSRQAAWGASGALLAGLLAWQAASALPTYPYFLNYLNPLWVDTASGAADLSMGSGEGLDQAAAYLNRLPGAEKLTVLSWYGTGPFSYYFHGQTIHMIASNPTTEAATLAHLPEMDYVVVYSNQWNRRMPAALFDRVDRTTPIQRIYLNDIEYVRIYAVSDLMKVSP